MTGKIPITDTEVFLVENEFPDEKIFGYFNFGQPTFVINDEELAKKMMIKDFEYFTDRRAILDSSEINNAFMTNLSGAEWKQIREASILININCYVGLEGGRGCWQLYIC